MNRRDLFKSSAALFAALGLGTPMPLPDARQVPLGRWGWLVAHVGEAAMTKLSGMTATERLALTRGLRA